jgi:antitoxin VapB
MAAFSHTRASSARGFRTSFTSPVSAPSEARTGEVRRLTARRHRGSQAVRLPKEFRLLGTEVRVRRVGLGLLLEPMEFDIGAWREALGRCKDLLFMEEGRKPPSMPEDHLSFEG